MLRLALMTVPLLCCIASVCDPAHAAEAPSALEPVMVDVPGGAFVMGHERSPQSLPVRSVTIGPFRMGKYEVTVAEFQRFVESSGYRAPRMCMQMASKRGFADVPNEYAAATTLQTVSPFEPASCIGWKDADAYVKWLAKQTGRNFRLPTEAEWEYAHRAGSTHRYFFGNDETSACRYGNVADRSADAALRRDFDLESKEYVGVVPCDDRAGYASIVGMYEANPFGLFDTLGNVAEFVADCWRDTYEGAPANGSAVTGAECARRVSRGGTWHARGQHATRRSPVAVSGISGVAGFRIAEDARPPGPQASRGSAGASEFERELASAQQAERTRRAGLAELPASPN